MNIEDPNFARRKILLGGKTNQYSPKKRWDQNVFGNQRKMLINYVQNTLKEHQNDGDILQKFRKQAQQLKMKKRKQKFPHLYHNSTQQVKFHPTESILKQSKPEYSRIKSPQRQQSEQYLQQRQSRLLIKQQPQLNYPHLITANYSYELQARLQYQRTIAQKNLQLYKKDSKIKRQKKQIKRLYDQLRQKQKQQELQKYIKDQQQMKKVNMMLNQMQQQLSSRKSLINDLKIGNKQTILNNQSLLLRLNQNTDKRRNKSQLYLNSYNKLNQLNQSKQNYLKRQNNHNQLNFISKNNPQVTYSPDMKKNKSSVFQKVPFFNQSKKIQIQDHLDQLKNYNKRLQYLHAQNQAKLNKIA